MIASFKRQSLAHPARLLACLLAAACLLVSVDARSDNDTPKEQAERFFLRGKALMSSGRYEEACVSFDESLRIERAGGTLLNLAECYVALQRYASASAKLEEARKLAADAHREDAEKYAAKRLGEVEPLVSHLVIRFPAKSPAGLAVTVDGQPLRARTARPTTLAVDPGSHVVRSTAPGYETNEMSFEIRGEKSELVVTVPTLRHETSKPEPTQPQGTSSSRSVQATIGWSVGSLGAGALIVGAGLGGAALSKWNDAKRRCPHPTCSDIEGVSETTQARGLADGATLALGLGAASAALGISLVLTAPKEKARTELHVGAGSLSLEGTY